MRLGKATKFVANKLNAQANQLVIAEIGVRGGHHALGMLHLLSPKSLYLVDSYSPFTCGGSLHDNTEQDTCYLEMWLKLKAFLPQITFITRTSKFAINLFPDNFFDYVYIDANHDYEFIKFDIENWYKKVKVGGYLGGHDYVKGWGGVIKAVDDFVKNNSTSFVSFPEEGDWLIQK